MAVHWMTVFTVDNPVLSYGSGEHCLQMYIVFAKLLTNPMSMSLHSSDKYVVIFCLMGIKGFTKTICLTKDSLRRVCRPYANGNESGYLACTMARPGKQHGKIAVCFTVVALKSMFVDRRNKHLGWLRMGLFSLIVWEYLSPKTFLAGTNHHNKHQWNFAIKFN